MQIHQLSLPFLLGPWLVPIDIHLRVPIELLAELIELLDAVVLN